MNKEKQLASSEWAKSVGEEIDGMLEADRASGERAAELRDLRWGKNMHKSSQLPNLDDQEKKVDRHESGQQVNTKARYGKWGKE